MILTTKEVFYFAYCSKCKHKDLDESEEPCNECLTFGENDNSHKPIRFEEDKNGS